MKRVFTSLALLLIFSQSAFTQEDMKNYLPEGAKARIGKGYVYDMAFSPDNTQLAVASKIGIWLYDTETGEPVRLLAGHTSYVGCVDFSPDGGTLASGGYDKTLRLWNAHTGEHKTTLTGHTEPIYSVAFSRDGETLASGSRDEYIKFWDVRTGELLRTMPGHAGGVYTVVYSSDGRTLASYGSDRRIHVWDAATGEFVMGLDPEFDDDGLQLDRIYSIGYSPDGQRLASGNSDGTIQLWDIRTGQLQSTLLTDSRGVTSVTFSPDGQVLAGGVSVEKGATIQFWNVASGKRLKSSIGSTDEGPIDGGRTDRITSLVFSTDGGTLVSASDDGTIRLWDPVTGTPSRTITGHWTSPVRDVMYASHGRILACARTYSLQLWEPRTGKLLKSVGLKEGIACIAYSPDNVTFAYETFGGSVRLLDVNADAHDEITLIADAKGVSSLDFNRDGSVLAGNSYDNDIIYLWNVDTGKLRKTLAGHIDRVQHVAFSPNRLILASGSDDGTIRLWDINTGDTINIFDGHADRIRHLAFSPTGQTLASADGDGAIELWDITTGELLKTITPASGAFFTAYSPDGETLASSDREAIHLWDVDSGELLQTFTGHVGSIYAIAFSPDGRTLTSGGSDGTLLLWEVTQ